MANKISYESSGGSVLTIGCKIFGYSFLAGVVALFLSFSLSMLSTGMLTQTVGYHEYEVIDGEQVLVETVWFDEDTTYESEMETATDDRRVSREMIVEPKNATCAVLVTALDVIEQLLMITVLVTLCGYYVYVEGDRDRNLVKYHQRENTPLRGLWIGLVAAAPALLLYVLLVLGKCGILAESVQGIYRTLNASFTPLIGVIMPLEVYPATALTATQLLLLLLLQLVLPVSCAVAYLLGYHRVFKKKK